MDYKNKYLKYKNKYLKYKNNFLYLGGAKEQKESEIYVSEMECLITYLKQKFGLDNKDLIELTKITIIPDNLFQKISSTVQKELELPDPVQTIIKLFINDINTINKIFIRLYYDHTDVYKSITGPNTWEKRMIKIINLLQSFSECTNDNEEKTDNGEKTRILIDIIHLYQLLIYDIITYNDMCAPNEKFYTVNNDDNDNYSIVPGDMLKKVFELLIGKLEEIRGRKCNDIDISNTSTYPQLSHEQIIQIQNTGWFVDTPHDVLSAIIGRREHEADISKKITVIEYILKNVLKPPDNGHSVYFYNYIMKKGIKLLTITVD